MRSRLFLQYGVLTIGYLVSAHPPTAQPRTPRDALAPDPVCVRIQSAISSASDVYYPGSLHYDKDLSHYASSSSQISKCSVEPGTAGDVGAIIKILGETKTPFAIKGGGHSGNPGFSSTPGVQIAMYRFSGVVYSSSSQTVDIGAGLVWDDVYSALEKYNVNVVGGRVSGVGVAGFTLGGGYSWKTNQYGLTVDTVTAFELVKPSGDVVNVTGASNPDLFFALRGGFNNFGIVTKFTLKTFPQTQVWGGIMTFTLAQIDDVSAATSHFQSVTDPKAAIITTFNFLLGQPGIVQLMFYDAPTPPEGIFDAFLAIPHLTKDVSTRSFLSLVGATPANATAGSRGLFNTVSTLSLDATMLSAIVNETVFWGNKFALSSPFLSYAGEPFLANIFTHGASPTAYPPSRPANAFFPISVYYSWTSSLLDDDFRSAAKQSAAHLQNVAGTLNAEATEAALYGNYASYDTPVEKIYGNNLPALRRIKSAVDPNNVMDLAGGFKL